MERFTWILRRLMAREAFPNLFYAMLSYSTRMIYIQIMVSASYRRVPYQCTMTILE